MEVILYKLSKSKFRSKFKLSLKDKNYIKENDALNIQERQQRNLLLISENGEAIW